VYSIDFSCNLYINIRHQYIFSNFVTTDSYYLSVKKIKENDMETDLKGQAKITVFGVGGAGVNIIIRMKETKVHGLIMLRLGH